MKKLCLGPAAILIMTSLNTSAYALSCARGGFDLATNYNQHAASAQKIMYVVGTFKGAPKRKSSFGGKTSTYKLSFKGSAIGKSGLKSLSKTISVNAQCLASWCGRIPTADQSIIAAVEVGTGGKLTLNSGPCDPNQFEGSKQNILLVRSCMKNGRCK